MVQAARYLKVPPWDLAQQSVYWLNAAEEAQQVEELHAEHLNSKQKG